MKKRIVVLGAGRVGKVIAADLSQEYDVTSADVSAQALERLAQRYPVKTQVADLGDAQAVTGAIGEADLVVCAVPGFMGFATLKTVIEAGKDVVDISFFAEEAFDLDDLAKRHNVTAVVDCGVAPGVPDYLAGYFAGKMQIDDLEYMVGGLHFHRSGPDQYLPTFSPVDVWEEYTRPVRHVRDGKLITKPPLSEPELLKFQINGEEMVLEAFNTDGLRSLITTMAGRIPNMREKTLRYPGHIAYIGRLQQTGQEWVPDKWSPKEDEDEFTVTRIVFRGSEHGRPKKITYTSLVMYDPVTQFSSMSRVTGYSCTGVARCVLDGTYRRVGISPPSYVGEAPGCAERILAHLQARGIVFEKEEEAG